LPADLQADAAIPAGDNRYWQFRVRWHHHRPIAAK
jgi:hypothetical protein